MSPGASDGLLYLDLYNFTILEWLQSFLKQHMSVQHVMLILNVLELKKMRYKIHKFCCKFGYYKFNWNENLLSILKLCFPGIPMDINEIRNPTFAAWNNNSLSNW